MSNAPATVVVGRRDGAIVTRIAPTRDARFLPHLLIAITGVFSALAFSRPEPAVLAAPFFISVVLGIRVVGRLPIVARVEIDDPQILEGDTLTGTVYVERPIALQLDVLLDHIPGGRPISPSPVLGWSVAAQASPRPDTVRLRFAVQMDRWGRHQLGQLWVRARVPHGLVVWEAQVALGPLVRVLPRPDRLQHLLDPAASHATAGAHVARTVGDGSEFAEIRPYQPGDRLRDLNWRATARTGEPHVNRFHPERAGEVVVYVDTSGYHDAPDTSHQLLARSARISWALARAHLAAQDRVGLLAHGGTGTWLHPAAGTRARYQLLEELLGVGGAAASGRMGQSVIPERVIPPAALVIAVTPLWTGQAMHVLYRLRGKGRAVVAVVVDVSDVLPSPEDRSDALAQRMFSLAIDTRRRGLQVVGIPVVTSKADDQIGSLVQMLRGSRRRLAGAR